jgi:hypothetical protein
MTLTSALALGTGAQVCATNFTTAPHNHLCLFELKPERSLRQWKLGAMVPVLQVCLEDVAVGSAASISRCFLFLYLSFILTWVSEWGNIAACDTAVLALA